MSEELLHGSDVVAVFEKMGSERMTQAVTRRSVRQARLENGLSESPLHGRLMKVMAAPLASDGIHVVTRCGEDPMPRPLSAGVRVLPLQGMREFDPTRAGTEVRVVQSLDGFEMGLQLRVNSRGEHRAAVTRALTAPDDNLVAREIDVLDSKTAALEQAQAGAVEDRGHECVRPGEAME